MLFADLRLEGTTLGSIDPIPGENIRDGDTYGDGGDYQRGIQAVHAGSHEIRHLPVRCAWGHNQRIQSAVHQHSRHHRDNTCDSQNLMRGVENMGRLNTDYRYQC